MSFAALCHYAVLLKWSAATLTSYDNIASNFSIQIARRKVMTASESFAFEFEREDDRRVGGERGRFGQNLATAHEEAFHWELQTQFLPVDGPSVMQ